MRPIPVCRVLGITTCFLAVWRVAALATDIENKLNLGSHWYGPNLTKEDLQGKVVLFVEARSVT